ncbi:Transcriptional regulatory protein, C terminal [Tranquillimonas rosea]|uniref:Transcriptional regulatory protein, C terminal n=1 Tax=Tranquillimonas rosea TaxID=641238 RepID=A0A1H9P4C6_9RHOB|nr:winged helix-turn-helix domain-containing protein [Tranquillimonas rosea]SER43038.1 Transcriptional regulatory protein, C terminal [Tranquillimonas rosea]
MPDHTRPPGPGLTFSDDFSSALRPDGSSVTFTAAEAEILRYLAGRPGITVTRSQLLDVITEPGSDKRDRVIDSYIVRLRRKFGGQGGRRDGPIQTRYGVGYAWIETSLPAHDEGGADIVFGPVRGLEYLTGNSLAARRFVDAFAPRFAAQFGPSKTVVRQIDPTFQSELFHAARYGTTVILNDDERGVEGIFETKELTTGRVITVSRHRIVGADADPAAEIARYVVADFWRGLALLPEMPAPVPVMMNNASIEIAGDANGSDRTDAMLNVLLSREPGSPELILLSAIALHSRYILNGVSMLAEGTEAFEADVARIRASLDAAHPDIADNPMLSIAAAKLLHFANPDRRAEALCLAEEAHASSRSFAGSLVTMAQLRALEGDPETALRLLDQGLELTEEGSEFEAYFLVLKCQFCRAVGDRAALRESLGRIYQWRSHNRAFFDLIFEDSTHPSEAARGLLSVLSVPQAHGVLRYVYYLTASLFRHDAHRDAVLRPSVQRIYERFGPDGLPDEIADVLGALAPR